LRRLRLSAAPSAETPAGPQLRATYCRQHHSDPAEAGFQVALPTQLRRGAHQPGAIP